LFIIIKNTFIFLILNKKNLDKKETTSKPGLDILDKIINNIIQELSDREKASLSQLINEIFHSLELLINGSFISLDEKNRIENILVHFTLLVVNENEIFKLNHQNIIETFEKRDEEEFNKIEEKKKENEKTEEKCICGVSINEHPEPLCTDEKCEAPLYFQGDLIREGPPEMRRKCHFCNKRHLKVLIQQHVIIEKDTEIKKITVLETTPTQNKKTEDSMENLLISCNNLECRNVVEIPQTTNGKTERQFCTKCATNETPEEKNKEKTKEDEPTSCFYIQPPFLKDYDEQGRRLASCAPYLPEDTLTPGFTHQEPEWEFPSITVPNSSFSINSDLYFDISKYHFLSRCSRVGKCILDLNGRYVFKSFCQINDYYDHNRAREDNPQHRSLNFSEDTKPRI